MPLTERTERDLLTLVGFGPGAVVNLVDNAGEVVGTAKVAPDGSIPVDGVRAFVAIVAQNGERVDLADPGPPAPWMFFTGVVTPRLTD